LQKTITVRNALIYQLSYAHSWYTENWKSTDSVKKTKGLAQFNGQENPGQDRQ
jgi:arabinogalactan endo-1,4-beta-galactosidase